MGVILKAPLIEKYGSDIVLPDPCVQAFFAKEEPEFNIRSSQRRKR